MNKNTKTLCLFFVATAMTCGAGNVNWTDESRKREAAQALLWENELAKAKATPAPQKLDRLALGLRNMGHRNARDGHSPEITKIYKAIQQEFLSTPGHAAHFADRIKGGREEFVHIPGSYDFQGYDTARNYILGQILEHLPSPETIAVFGDFLDDERDLPVELPFPPDQANCDYAINGLRRIGLRGMTDIGRTNRPDNEHIEDLARWRSWWKKVKAGKLAFSFEGENVEYRFKPDGTWIEGQLGKTRREDRATHSRGGELRKSKRRGPDDHPAAEASPGKQEKTGRLPWFVAILLAILGYGIYFFKIRGRIS